MSEQLKKGQMVVFENQGKIYRVAEDEMDGKVKLSGYGDSLFKASDFNTIEMGILG